ncbi:F-box protein interaction domain protein [Heracleum sosnowskyi]|uniref:F-box protein interaction domain protein n=1 Tax=Heracleum sosnowskyi TaxID=360622 RepID=A0AAD8HLA8_9APIA|nr:F-box protein interaction domain protein [Heracleum sosnowskyi]
MALEMLDEILCRLPVKYLLRCRCVSKGWCSLIDSNPFVKKHLKRALECNVGALIINQRGKFYLAEDFKSNLDDDDDAVAVEMMDPLKTLISAADFVGSANGLVCVSKNQMNEFVVFNPSTRKSRKIPSAPAEFPRSFHMTETSLCGFGYDRVNDDYKVVKIAECYLQFRGIMAIVYSLKTNSWKRIQNVPVYNKIRFSGKWGMFASGALHWLAIKNPVNCSDIIVGFDLGLEQFKEVPFPVIEGPIVNFNTTSVVSDGGTLCVLDKYPNTHIDVWVMMTDSGAENSWSKALSVKKKGTLPYLRFVRPVSFCRSGQSVLLEVDSSKLVWYDMERKTVKNVSIRGIPNRFDSHVFTHSLIPLNEDNPPQKPSEDKPQKKYHKRRDDFLSRGFKLRL